MDDLVRRWQHGWGLCRGIASARELAVGAPAQEQAGEAAGDRAEPEQRGDTDLGRHWASGRDGAQGLGRALGRDGALGLGRAPGLGGALEVRLGLPGREWEVFLLGDDPAVIEWFAGRAGVATWVTVTTHRENEVAAQLTRLGLGLFPEWKLLMSIGLRDHPDAAAASEYRVERTTSGALDYVRILAAEGTVAARGMAAVVGADAVMHDIHTEPAHRRRGLGSVVMAELARRAVARGATTGLLMATADGAQLYRRLGWSSEAAMLTASGLGAEGTSGLGAAGAEGGDLRPVLAGR